MLNRDTMKKVFFWPYQLYAWLIVWPLAVILTLLFSALAVIFSRVSPDMDAEGASSMIFWYRRCREHSRSKRWTEFPC